MLTRRHALALSFVGLLSLWGGTALAGCLDATRADGGAGGQGGDQEGDGAQGSGGAGTDGQVANNGETAELRILSTFLFDTYIEIKALCEQRVLDSLNERLVFFENSFSRTREGSDIFKINTANGAPVKVHEETASLIRQARAYSELSGGLFDISIGAVSSLWDFKEGIIPHEAVLAEAVTHVDYRKIELSSTGDTGGTKGTGGTTVTLADPAARLDLGGIAKGYAADEMVRLLNEAGCKSALINLGGNVYALGSKPNGSPWTVGIQDPLRERGALKATVAARDLSVVTSGPYERSFEVNGVRYHHILDPRTGYPVQTDLASATILSERSADGDALTTCCFLLGSTAARELVAGRPGIEALFVDASGTALPTDGAMVELL